jgi:hypothetical protein
VIQRLTLAFKRKFGMARLKSFTEYRNNVLDNMRERVSSRGRANFHQDSETENEVGALVKFRRRLIRVWIVWLFLGLEKENTILLHEIKSMKILV